MTRRRVEERAEIIYAHLKANLNKPYTISDLLAELYLTEGATTRAAIRRARDMAQEDGLCFPVACAANGNTYCVTDDPSAVIDPALHLGSIALGVGVRKDVHDDFLNSRMSALSPADRAMVHSLQKYDAAQRLFRDAHRDVLKTIVGIRREQRRED